MPAQNEPPKTVKAISRALSTGVGGVVLGGLDGGMLGAALSEKTVEVVGKAWDEIRPTRLRQVASTVQLAADELGLDAEGVVALADHDVDAKQLFYEAMEAAAGTLSEKKIEGLARALANGLRDDRAHIDRESLVVRALDDVEEPHIRVLLVLAEQPSARASESHLRFNEGLDRVVIHAVLAVLTRLGLVDSDDDFAEQFTQEVEGGSPRLFDPEWRVTPFGQLCLARLGYEPPTPQVASSSESE